MNVAGDTPQKTPERILYVITKANWGGAQRYVYDLALGAQRRGYEVAVAYGTEGELTQKLEAAGIPTYHIEGMGRDIKLGSDFRALLELYRLMRTLRPTVVHSNSSKAGGLAALAARLSGIRRIVFTAHGWAFNEDRPSWQRALIWFMHYLTVLLSHTTICVSHAARRDASSMPFVQRTLHVIHNGIGTHTLLSRDEARVRLAPQFSTTTWIGTIAELHPTKQLHVLIEAFQQLSSQSNLSLVIMGEGQERIRLETLIQSHDLEARVRLVGHVADASSYLSALDIFVLPSRSEGLGYVILEAGQAGLPVVASRVGGIPEVIEDGSTGLLVPPGNTDALTKALEALLSDSERSRSYGEALRERVRKEFSLEDMLTSTLSFYR